jgi:hypothetical protein
MNEQPDEMKLSSSGIFPHSRKARNDLYTEQYVWKNTRFLKPNKSQEDTG